MLVQQQNYLNSLAVALLLVCSGTQARAELEPAGLAVYTETARDVYVAALLLPPGSRLEDIVLAPGPRAMEFRIALRRISSRGFSGMLLLQGELGSGSRAPEQVIGAISKLKNKIKSALKRGDRFIIALSKNDTTSFVLNGVELLSIDDSLVFNFFFTGWVGESSSVFFRDTLLSGHLDAGTLAWYESLAPSDERLAITSSWGAAPAALSPAPALAVASASQVAASLQLAASSTVNARPETTRLSATRRVAEPVTPVAKKKPAAGKKSASKPTQVASLAKAVADTDAPQFDDREYQRQLKEYVTHIMKKVFSKVVYPRRAIKREHQGKVELLVHLDENGELLEVSLDNSSGHNMLDAAARKAVRKAAPFPELTLVAREEFLSEDGTGYIMPIPITFKLSN
jgi:TonB family protein